MIRPVPDNSGPKGRSRKHPWDSCESELLVAARIYGLSFRIIQEESFPLWSDGGLSKKFNSLVQNDLHLKHRVEQLQVMNVEEQLVALVRAKKAVERYRAEHASQENEGLHRPLRLMVMMRLNEKAKQFLRDKEKEEAAPANIMRTIQLRTGETEQGLQEKEDHDFPVIGPRTHQHQEPKEANQRPQAVLGVFRSYTSNQPRETSPM